MKKTLLSLLSIGMILSMSTPLYAKSGLNKNKLYMYVGDTSTLKVSGVKKVKWRVNNKNVTVKKGKVKAYKAGRTKVKATVGHKTYTCLVYIAKKPQVTFKAALVDSKVSITAKGSGGFGVKKYQYAYTLNNKKVTFKKYTTATKASFTYPKAGTYTLSVSVKDHRGKKASSIAKVTLSPKTNQTTIKSTTTSQSSSSKSSPVITAMTCSKSTVLLGDNINVSGQVANTNEHTAYVMQVTNDAGDILASNNGQSISFTVDQIAHYTITLTATNDNGLKAIRSYDFTTISPVIQPGTITTAYIGKSYQAYVENANANIKWHFVSSNPQVASVNDQGVITTLSQGTTSITATYKNNTASQKCTVQVN